MKKLIASILSLAVMTSSMTIIPLASVNAAETTNGEYEIRYDASDRVIVSLGDSYSAGEGLDDYYGSTLPLEQKVKSQDWLSHRSPNSWPGQLTLADSNKNKIIMNTKRNENWYFAAMSGAVTYDIDHTAKKDYRKFFLTGENTSSTKEIKYDGIKFKMGSTPIDPQIEMFEQLGSKKADYVTMTLGGNDVQFVPIVESTALNCKFLEFATSKVDVERCNELSEKINNWDLKNVVGSLVIKHGLSFLSMSNLENYLKYIEDSVMPKTISDLEKIYYLIEEKAGKQAHIIIAGYPKIISERNDNPIWTADEARSINEKVSLFNKQIADKVKELHDNGMNISFVSVEDEFDDHGAYSTNGEYINGLSLSGKQELSDFTPVGGCSFHPNSAGVEAYRNCVQNEIKKIEEEKTRIWGRVTDKNNNPISGVEVIQTDDNIDSQSSKTDSNGIYCIELNYEEGRHYNIKFEGEGYESLVVKEENGGHRININAKLKAKDGTISGKVLTEGNTPIENAKVAVNGNTVYTNANGEFSISLPNGNYYFEVSCDGYQTAKIANIAVKSGKTTNLNDVVLKKENKQIYSAEELIDKSIPEIIK